MGTYFLYILECADNTLYCGITNDLERREEEHNASTKGAKYTSGRRPVKIVYSEKLTSKSEALKREIAVKKLSRQQKIDLMKNKNLKK